MRDDFPMPAIRGRRFGLLIGSMGLLSTFASADVILSYSSSADIFPNTPEIEVFSWAPFTINISASSSGAPITNGGGFAFTFSVPAGVTFHSFTWDGIFSDPNNWFSDPMLPTPSVVSFAPSLTLPTAPASLPIASLTASLHSIFPGPFNVETGAQAFDTNGGNLSVSASSGNIRLLTPEPAMLGLLLIGLVAMNRRRLYARSRRS